MMSSWYVRNIVLGNIQIHFRNEVANVFTSANLYIIEYLKMSEQIQKYAALQILVCHIGPVEYIQTDSNVMETLGFIEGTKRKFIYWLK